MPKTPDFYYLESDGQVFLVRDGRRWRFPRSSRELPCRFKPVSLFGAPAEKSKRFPIFISRRVPNFDFQIIGTRNTASYHNPVTLSCLSKVGGTAGNSQI